MQLEWNCKLVRGALVLLCGAALACSMSSCGGKMDKNRSGKPEVTSATQSQAPAAEVERAVNNAVNAAKIAYLTFSLPEQVKWTQSQDASLREAGIAEFYVEGTTAENTPARVIYQRLSPVQARGALQDRITSPLKQCPDSSVDEFKGASKFRDQLNFLGMCSKMGTEDYGLLSYVSVFSDASANHLVMAEVRTPPSEKAGVLTFKDAETQRLAQTSKALSDMLLKTMQSIRACNEKNLCI